MATLRNKQLRALSFINRDLRILIRDKLVRTRLTSRRTRITILISARLSLTTLSILSDLNSIRNRNTNLKIQRRTAQARRATRATSLTRRIQDDGRNIRIRRTTLGLYSRIIVASSVNTDLNDLNNLQTANRRRSLNNLADTIERISNAARRLINLAQIGTRARRDLSNLIRIMKKRTLRRDSNLINNMRIITVSTLDNFTMLLKALCRLSFSLSIHGHSTRQTDNTLSSLRTNLSVTDERVFRLSLNSFTGLHLNSETSLINRQILNTLLGTDNLLRRDYDQQNLRRRNRKAVFMGNSLSESSLARLILHLNVMYLTRIRSIRTVQARDQTRQQNQINLTDLSLRLSRHQSFLLKDRVVILLSVAQFR